METIYENYHVFITEHNDDLGTPQGALRMLNDDAMFMAYMDTLTDGIDPGVAAVCKKVGERNREMLLESANVGASSFASGWTVLSFPILVDIYSVPTISELMNVYPIDKPLISIPRIRIKATTTSYDGTTKITNYIPTATKSIRADIIEVTVVPDTVTNIFTSTMLSPEKMKMNRKFTLLSRVIITEKDPTNTVVEEKTVEVNFRPDNRSQISNEFEYEDAGGQRVNGNVHGHIDYDKGIVQFHVNLNGGTGGHTYNCTAGIFNLKFMPVATMDGRTKVTIENETTDVFIDVNEDFMIDMTEEQLQDYSSIFKIDLLRTLGEAIKRQILLNKDFELAYLLKISEIDMQKQGAKQTLDLEQYSAAGGTGEYTPASVLDVLKAIVPRISTLYSTIRRNFNMYPQYAVTGLKTAAYIRSLQDMLVNMPGMKGELGFSGATAQFMKLKVLECLAVDEDKIYLSTKAPDNALEKSSIIDLVFQPLYIVKETTDGNLRQFVRSRTSVEITRTDGLGYMHVKNMEKYVG